MELLKLGADYILYPLIILIGYFGRRSVMRIDKMEEKILELDKLTSIQNAQLQDIKEDISQINRKLDKILDKL